MRYQIYGDWMVDARTWYEMTAEELKVKRIWAKEQLAKRDARKALEIRGS